MSDSNITLTKNEMLELLHAGQCTVTFTKTTGEQRVMKCSLNSADLPITESKGSGRAENANTIRVWDLEKAGWRSFRVDSVTAFDTLHEQAK